jgi:hypothetical protein
MQPDRGRAGPAVKDEAHRARFRVRVGKKIGRGEHGRFRLAALLVQAAGRYRHKRRDRAVFHRAAIQHDARFALARILGEQLVDLFAQSLLCLFSRRRGGRRFAHGSLDLGFTTVKGWRCRSGLDRPGPACAGRHEGSKYSGIGRPGQPTNARGTPSVARPLRS